MQEILNELGISQGQIVTAVVAIGIFLLILLIATIVWIFELVDIARREFRSPQIKATWFLVVFFSHVVGSIAYHFAGRKTGRLPRDPPFHSPESPPPFQGGAGGGPS